MVLSQVVDKDPIKAFLTHPDIWPHVCEGFPESECDPSMSALWLMASDEAGPGVLFLFIPRQVALYEIHIQAMRSWRGEKVRAAAREAMKWLSENTPAVKVTACVPVTKPHVLNLAGDVGYEAEGVCRASFPEDGILHDQIYLGYDLKRAG